MSKQQYILVREELGDQKTYGTFTNLKDAIQEFCGLAPDFFSHVPQCPTPKQLFEEYNETIIDAIEVHGIWQEYGDDVVRGQFIILLYSELSPVKSSTHKGYHDEVETKDYQMK